MVNLSKLVLPLALMCLVLAPPSFSETDIPDEVAASETDSQGGMMSDEVDSQERMTIEEFLAALNFRKGTIQLDDDLVTLNLPETFSYLSPDDAERVLVDVWGNPPGNETLGMIVPDSPSLFDMDAWAVIVSYEEDGYVSDKDAKKIDYDELLDNMKSSSAEHNKVRIEAGYDPIDVVGWAAAPFYDEEAKKLHWAKEVRFGDSDVNTLNYNIRILGRKGVLILNIVAGMPQFETINAQIPTLLSMTEFNPGQRYADFDPKIDTVAAYGIGALIAGKVAAKAGLLAKLGGILFAMKKFLILAVVALAAFFKALFGKKKAKVNDGE